MELPRQPRLPVLLLLCTICCFSCSSHDEVSSREAELSGIKD